jgi:hypothetical protein
MPVRAHGYWSQALKKYVSQTGGPIVPKDCSRHKKKPAEAGFLKRVVSD